MIRKYIKYAAGAALLSLVQGALCQEDIDVSTFTNGFRVQGPELSYSGVTVTGAGDVNRDGFADIAIGTTGLYAAGAFVAFGKADQELIQLSSLDESGFRIGGLSAANFEGSFNGIEAAGDVNGDGLTDFVIGSYFEEELRAYVVFGKATTSPIDVRDLGSGGFRIFVQNGGKTAALVSGGGDFNGDGLDDVIVATPDNRSGHVGTVYVVFGKADTLPVDLNNLEDGGFRVTGDVTSLSGAGDVNGDGFADFLVGARSAPRDGAANVGEAHVVFGKANTAGVDLSDLGRSGFRIRGSDAADFFGQSVSGAGDVNGDGFADVIIGSRSASACVVFGKAGSSDVDMREIDGEGFCMILDGPDVDLSTAVGGAGDVNGDGFADVVIGLPETSADGVLSGEGYVVYGGEDAVDVDLNDIQTAGFRIGGFGERHYGGASVSGAGDVNGDGLADLIVGAYGAHRFSGESYVIFSEVIPPQAASFRSFVQTGDAPPVAIGVTGDGSNHSTPDSRVWIDFADGTVPLFSGPPYVDVTLTRSAGAFPGQGADVSWEIRTDRIQWTRAELTFKYVEPELQIGNERSLCVFKADSPTGPYLPLATLVDAETNTLRATVAELGYFHVGNEFVFDDGFEI